MNPTSLFRFVVPNVLALAIVALLSACSKPAAPQTFATANERMQHEAKVAAEKFTKETGLNLDYSITSVKFVEQALGRVADSVGKTDRQAAENQALAYGAYVGECLRKKHGGEWSEVNAEGKTTFVLKTATGATLNPIAWCLQRITGTEQDHIHKKVVAESKALGTSATPAAAEKP